MNKHRLLSFGRAGLLCLLVGSIPLGVTPAVAQQGLVEPDLHPGASPAAQSQPPVKAPSANSLPTTQRIAQLEDTNLSNTNLMQQVTSVSQLSDVDPTHWAFQALQSLVERYGCIEGYPDRTYRGNRALTRYEFAAGLNACLDRIQELIAAAVSDLPSKDDIATIRRLQEEFATELATLRSRVDALEARTAELEANQFSTTTKLQGQAIFAVTQGFGGSPNGDNTQTIFVDRVRLNLITSFSGKDLLITGLQAYNFGGDALTGRDSIQGTLFPPSPLSEGMAKLSFEPQFPGFDAKDLSRTGVGNNDITLYKLLYIFPVAGKFSMFVAPAVEASDAFPAITPFADEGQEALSRFAGYNPVVRVSGGTSGTGLASAAGFIWNPISQIDIRALYGSVNANLPSNGPDLFPGVSVNPLGAGFFSGSYVAAAQLTFKPVKSLDIAFNYAHSYHEINILGTGLSQASVDPLGLSATRGFANSLGIPVKVDSLGGTLTWRFTPKVALSGYGAAFFVDDSSSKVDASSTLTSWMVGLHFKDLFKSGNTAGLIFGQPLYRVDADGDGSLEASSDVDRATPYHLEGYYRFQVSNNISVTPGAFVLFNPEGDKNNDTTFVGVIRTTFSF